MIAIGLPTSFITHRFFCSSLRCPHQPLTESSLILSLDPYSHQSLCKTRSDKTSSVLTGLAQSESRAPTSLASDWACLHNNMDSYRARSPVERDESRGREDRHDTYRGRSHQAFVADQEEAPMLTTAQALTAENAAVRDRLPQSTDTSLGPAATTATGMIDVASSRPRASIATFLDRTGAAPPWR